MNLGLERHNYSLFWQGKGGMNWFDIIPKIKLLLRYESPPEILVIHCGANDHDIGKIPLLRFRAIMQSTITELNRILPNTTIGWSNICQGYPGVSAPTLNLKILLPLDLTIL